MTVEQQEVTRFTPDGGVVVGDDGSHCASTAIRAAAEEATRRGRPLHVVRAWSILNAERPADVPRGVVPTVLELEAATLDWQRRRVAKLLPDATGVEVHVVHGPAAKVIVETASTADLLVVGSRGGGGFRHMLLGSVAEQAVRYAECSVLVVRSPRG